MLMIDWLCLNPILFACSDEVLNVHRKFCLRESSGACSLEAEKEEQATLI